MKRRATQLIGTVDPKRHQLAMKVLGCDACEGDRQESRGIYAVNFEETRYPAFHREGFARTRACQHANPRVG